MATVETENIPDNLPPVTEDTNGENKVENPTEESPSPVVHGKRQRKAVQAFVSSPPPEPKKGLEFEVGNGTVLGDIEIVTEYMAKTTSDNYSTLHRLLFGVVGVALHRKKNIRRFNGYNFDKDSKQYEAKLAAMRKLKSVDRKLSMKLVGLNQSTTVADFLDFLVCPSDKGRHVPQRNKRKTPQKRKRSAESKGSPKKKKSPRKKKKTPEKYDDTDTDDEISLSDSEESEDEDKSAEKKLKVSEEDVKEADVKEADVKEADVKEADVKEADVKEAGSALPTDEELVEAVKKVIEGVDLEEVSMKQALAMVYEKYPGQDLTVKKSFIKENIRKEIEKG